MNGEWKKVISTRVALAMHVPAVGGKSFHQNRPTHGLILNDSIASKDYVFSDGRVLHTEADELFYLPRGSTYQVKTYEGGSCYAINFDAEFSDEPFTMSLRDVESFRKHFREAAKKWKSNSELRELAAMRSLYEIILMMNEEREKIYHPTQKYDMLAPAIKAIKESFCENELSVCTLASLCGVGDAYFRRIFRDRFGISPKEYIIRLRIDYAKQLLSSGQFSVSDAARICGYTEACHFSREFKKRVGSSPKDYI